MSRRTVGGSGALARTRAAHARPRVRRKEFFFTKSRVAVHRAVVAGRRVAVVIIARRARARERCRAIRFTNASRRVARSSDYRAVVGLARTVRTTRRALASRSLRPRRRVRAPRVVATPPGGRLLFETPHGPYPQSSPDRRPRAAHRDAMTRVATRATPARATTSTSTSSRTARRDARSRRIATRAGFDLGKLASVLRKKTAMDVERVFNGTSKTRERLSAVNDVLALWRMEDFDDALEELEETLLGADFGPKAATRVTDGVRARVERGECKTGGDVRRALKASIVEVLTKAGDAMKIGLNETAVSYTHLTLPTT